MNTASKPQSPALLYIIPLVTIAIWSGNSIVTKAAAGAIAPSSIAFYRWVIALIILLPFVGPAAWKNRNAAKRVWKQLFMGGVLGMVVYQCLAYVAAETTTAVNMGVIQALMPLMSTLLASAIASEQLTKTRMFGSVISILGLVYLCSRGNPVNLLRGGLHVGDALMLIAVIANASYGVFLKRWGMNLPVWQQLFWQIVAAVIILFPIWLLGPISPITAQNFPLVLYAGVLASVFGPLGWMVGIRTLGAARCSMTANLLPIIVAVLAWAILGEHLYYYHYIGGGVALLGVIIGLREWKFRKSKDKDFAMATQELEEL